MDRLTLKVAARCAGPVVPFRPVPKSSAPKVEIGGKHYVLSTDGGPLGDSSDPDDHGMFGYGDSEEGHARLIKGPEHSNKFRYLWAFDTERKTLGMWRVTDGNEKHYGSAQSEQGRIIRLEKKGELNRVSGTEMKAIEHEMRRRESEHERDLKQYLQEIKSDFNKNIDKLAEEFFQHYVKPKLEKSLSDVKRGVVPLGFKPFGPGMTEEHARLRQTMSYVVGHVFRREMSPEKFEAYVREFGLDPDSDPQTVHWAIEEILENVYRDYLPPYHGS